MLLPPAVLDFVPPGDLAHFVNSGDWRDMGLVDTLTESMTSQTASGNPLEILPPRERAVLVLLGSGLDATTVAKLLHVSRETLYQDRRRAWRALAPVIPGRLLSEYEAARERGRDRRALPPVARLVQEAGERGLSPRAAEERLREGAQARAARALLGRAEPHDLAGSPLGRLSAPRARTAAAPRRIEISGGPVKQEPQIPDPDRAQSGTTKLGDLVVRVDNSREPIRDRQWPLGPRDRDSARFDDLPPHVLQAHSGIGRVGDIRQPLNVGSSR